MKVAKFTDEQKTLAKTLAIATGSTDAALEYLRAAWGVDADEDDFALPDKVPSERSIRVWKSDPRIPVDEELLREFSNRARASVLGASERLTERMGDVVLTAINRYEGGAGVTEKGSALDILNVTKSYGILADKLNGRYGNAPQPGGIQVNGGNVQFLIWAPKPPPESRDVEVLDAAS